MMRDAQEIYSFSLQGEVYEKRKGDYFRSKLVIKGNDIKIIRQLGMSHYAKIYVPESSH